MLLFADAALAVNLPQPGDSMGTVGSGLSSTVCAGGVCGDDIGTVVFAIMSGLRLLVNVVGLLILVITGFILVTSQDENQVSVAKKATLAAIGALILINLAEPIRDSFIATGTGNGAMGAGILSVEIMGIINFVEEPMLIIAILMIIISGIRAIITFGTDQGVTNIRRTVFSILAGIVLVLAKVAIANSTGSTAEDVNSLTAGAGNDASGIVNVIIDVTRIIVAFMALAAVTVIVIAGIILVVNKGDQETANKAKGLIIRVLLGLAVILISYGLAYVFVEVANGF
ncbi:hypothetical protein COU78_04380 [Candidatus Peregrinibacteria bacterium CG10_big_fil_rev_8_21_14_0_10_49_24]|nr:MAG: hypothetical protein COU78_04380 [Candidatus Peregrinibacteria bacterium CG10_big_fil_rev_8_21_14_0_10_49_24]PJA67395.1 MAG: hypothetical protein CO157_04820 [Candidatus Peregrinibacteria bacterium CG_4_9_14_3_um_filter_49_12]